MQFRDLANKDISLSKTKQASHGLSAIAELLVISCVPLNIEMNTLQMSLQIVRLHRAVSIIRLMTLVQRHC